MWSEWIPPNAPHVIGKYSDRTYGPNGPDPQKVKVDCRTCGEHWETDCDSGRVKEHISRFASQHLHRDPLAAS